MLASATRAGGPGLSEEAAEQVEAVPLDFRQVVGSFSFYPSPPVFHPSNPQHWIKEKKEWKGKERP